MWSTHLIAINKQLISNDLNYHSRIEIKPKCGQRDFKIKTIRQYNTINKSHNIFILKYLIVSAVANLI